MHLSGPILGVGLFLVGSGLFGTLVSLELERWGASGGTVGLVLSAYFVGVILGALSAEVAVRRAGHVRCFAALATTFAAVALLHPLVRDLPTWFVLRLVAGMCLAGIFVVCESWLNQESSVHQRGGVLAAYMVASQIGLGGGQLLVDWFPLGGTEPYVLAAVAVCLSILPVALSTAPKPDARARPRMSVFRLIRLAPLGVAGCFVAGLLVGQLLSVTPVWAAQVGLDAESSGWLMACLMIGGLLLQWPAGRLSDRFGRLPVLLGVSVGLVALGLVSLPLTRWSGSLALVALGRGALTFLFYPLAVAQTNDKIDRRDVVAASGALVLAWGGGAALGPLFGTLLMSTVGPVGHVWASIAGAALFALFIGALVTLAGRGRAAMRGRRGVVMAPLPHSPHALERTVRAWRTQSAGAHVGSLTVRSKRAGSTHLRRG